MFYWLTCCSCQCSTTCYCTSYLFITFLLMEGHDYWHDKTPEYKYEAFIRTFTCVCLWTLHKRDSPLIHPLPILLAPLCRKRMLKQAVLEINPSDFVLVWTSTIVLDSFTLDKLLMTHLLKQVFCHYVALSYFVLSSFVAGLKYYKTSLTVVVGICQWALNCVFHVHPFKISGNNYLIYTIIPKIERNEAFMC